MSIPNTPDFAAKAPRSFSLSSNGRWLVLDWQDGSTAKIDAETLWTNCPSAAGRRRRLDGRTSSGDPALSLTNAYPIGNYALNLAFSDGHDRGVYPWGYLAKLAARPTLEAFLTPRVDETGCANEFHQEGH